MSGLEYYIDIVFCIDCSASMEPLFRELKEKVMRFPRDLVLTMREKDRNPVQLRTRIISFTDEVITPESTFINFGAETFSWAHHDSVRRLRVVPSSTNNCQAGLEALAVAMGSDWIQEGDRQRHIIVMFTNASSYPLHDAVSNSPLSLTEEINSSLESLTEIWDGGESNSSRVTSKLKRVSQRLVLCAPDIHPWQTIGDNWAETLFLPSKAGEGLWDLEYKMIAEVTAR